ncbi:MAG TPA: NADH-quinone oxidoreductase subunit J [Anaeromyxobacteraceae bacterium]
MSYVTEALLVLLALVALWTVQTTILRAAIGLALTSALVSSLLFEMGAPLAAVFELSVCAGLITVVFASTISMTRPIDDAEAARCRARRKRRFHPAFILVALVGVALWATGYALEVSAPAPEAPLVSAREVLWGARRLDLVGQLTVLFVGVFTVVVLFKERAETREDEKVGGAGARPEEKAA